MKTKSREEARQRTERLAELRNLHGEQYKETQALLKKQQAIRKSIQRLLQGGPLSVPRIANELQIPSQEILWYVATMKKYGLLEEAGMDDDEEYYLYGLVKEA
jgi:predicted transcriptional regulator